MAVLKAFQITACLWDSQVILKTCFTLSMTVRSNEIFPTPPLTTTYLRGIFKHPTLVASLKICYNVYKL